jgi:regulator of sirC expression with transglutaminase-like and TPR domain
VNELPRREKGGRRTGVVPTARQAALLKLLADEDPSVPSLVVEQLRSEGARGEAEIEALWRLASGPAAKVLDKVTVQLRRQHWEVEMEECCSKLTSLSDLENFCWVLARGHNASSPQDEAKELLDVWGATVRSRVGPHASEGEKLNALVEVLSIQEGLTGNTENYYEPENSFLDAVLFSREGIPITLTVIYMLVAQRAGMQVDGIGMPGHFLARIGSIYFDPFHGGAVVDRAKLEGALADAGVYPPYDVLESAALELIAQRMIFNLVTLYEKEGSSVSAGQYRRILGWLEKARN